jgi:cyclophilin family peptidyl-prolyl cis-trans isomerase
MHQDYALPPAYTIFGKVTSGIETVDKLASVETVMNVQGTEKSVPAEDLIVEKIEIK